MGSGAQRSAMDQFWAFAFEEVSRLNASTIAGAPDDLKFHDGGNDPLHFRGGPCRSKAFRIRLALPREVMEKHGRRYRNLLFGR
jgi:hypothetical protein